jgi:PAS domain S-box-containing protein
MPANPDPARRADAVTVAIAAVFRESAACRTEAAVGRACLGIAESLTASRFGFIGEINRCTGRLDCIAVSDPGREAGPGRDADDDARCPLPSFEIRGICGRVLRAGNSLFTNDPGLHPDNIGTPPGHAPLQAFLGVPLVEGDEIVGMIGLGKREGGYGPEQQAAVECLAPVILQVLRGKRMEAALRDSERRLAEVQAEHDRLSSVVASIQDEVWFADAEGQFTIVNPTAMEAFGLPKGESVDIAKLAGDLEVLHPDGSPRAVEQAPPLRALRGEHVANEEEIIRVPASGDLRYRLVSATPVRDGSGQIIGSVSVVRDITEQKRAELALEQERAKLDSVMRATDAMLVLLDPDFNFVWVNPAYAENCATEPQALVGRNHFSLFPNAENEAIFRQVRDTGEAVFYRDKPFSFPNQPERGTTYWDWSLVPVSAPAGGVDGLVFSLRETTRNVRAEQALRASEERFRGLVEQAVDGIFVADADGNYTDVNTAGAQMLGYTPAEIRRLNIADVIAPEETTRIPEEVLRFPDVTVVRSEWRFRRKDGSTFVGEVVGRRLPDGRLQAILRDVTERKKVEAALREADRRKDEFLATLAHELRNPLAPIRNAVEILRIKGSTDATAVAARDIIERQVVHMVHLIDDLLDVSRITRGKLHLRRQRLALATVLAQAVEASRPQIETAGHALVVESPADSILLDGDPVRLVQVFANLLDNACKYSDPGGQIRLATECVGDTVAVRVTDSGIGIPAEHLAGVFDMFSQVSTGDERCQTGLGIGLSLARALVEMHGGRIEAYSAGPGQGSTFTVWLPIASASEISTGVEPSAAGPVMQASARVLVVDDQDDVVESLGMLLRMHGNEVRTAHDGLEALEVAAQFRPALVLLDIGMPRLDGYGACRRLREQPWGKDMIIVAMTGWGQEADRRKTRAAGFDHHLVKPVDPAALLGLLADGAAGGS